MSQDNDRSDHAEGWLPPPPNGAAPQRGVPDAPAPGQAPVEPPRRPTGEWIAPPHPQGGPPSQPEHPVSQGTPQGPPPGSGDPMYPDPSSPAEPGAHHQGTGGPAPQGQPAHEAPRTHGHFAAPPGTSAHYAPTAPPHGSAPRKRGMPVWMALSGMLVIALIAGGAGGIAGGLLGSSGGQAAPEPDQGPTINEPPPEAPERAPDTTAGVAQRVSPSVVSLRSAGGRVGASGSGFVIEGDYVVTNDHVSAPLEEDGIVIEYSDDKFSLATVVGSDPSSDLAVLELEDPHDVEPLEFGNSDDAVVGDEVIAIGAPLGLAGTVTQGIISAVDRPVSSDEGESQFFALQTDAAINPGNSGGPLVDLQGRVIGVNSMIVTMGGGLMGEQPGGNIGLGFAIPSAEAEQVVNRMIDHGETTYADLGVAYDQESPVIGAVIADDPDAVERGGPAERAGLEPGDVIVAFDGRRVNSHGELQAMVRDRAAGDEVELEYERDGERETATVTLGPDD